MDVSKDLTQIRAMYKPQQVVWSGKFGGTLGRTGLNGMRKTRKHLNGRKEGYGPAQMADGKAFFDDGSEDITRHVKPNPEGAEIVKHMLIVRKRVLILEHFIYIIVTLMTLLILTLTLSRWL